MRTHKRHPSSGRVFIQNIDPSICEEEIEKLFEMYGKITEPIRIYKGYSFVQYDNMDSAEQAVGKNNGISLGNRTIDVKLARTGSSPVKKLDFAKKSEEIHSSDHQISPPTPQIAQNITKILHSAAPKLTEKPRPPVRTFGPHSYIVRLWKILLYLCWIHVLFILPFKTGFFPFHNNFSFFVIDLASDSILFIHTMYMATRIQSTIHGELVTDYYELRRRYMSHEFVMDFITSFPLDTLFEIYLYLFVQQDLSYEIILTLFRIPKIFLFLRLLETMNKLAIKLSSYINSAYIRLFSQMLLIYMVTHWVGCAWVLLSHSFGFGHDEFVMGQDWEFESVLSKYEYSLFWGLRQMTGSDTGTGPPQNRVERVFGVIISLAGLTIYATIIGSLSTIVQNVTEEQNFVHNKIEALHNYLRRKKIPIQLRTRITSYMEYKLHREHDEQEKQMLDELPEKLKADLVFHINRNLIMKVPFLQNCSDKIMSELILKLKPTVFAPNEYIFHAGETGSTMYFICKGQVEISTAEGEAIVKLGSGSFIGEMELLNNTAKEMNVKSLTFCDTLELSREDLLDVAERYGGDFLRDIQETSEKRKTENRVRRLSMIR
jgi:hypothetical protein